MAEWRLNQVEPRLVAIEANSMTRGNVRVLLPSPMKMSATELARHQESITLERLKKNDEKLKLFQSATKNRSRKGLEKGSRTQESTEYQEALEHVRKCTAYFAQKMRLQSF